MKDFYVAGVDIGGTHITAALVNMEEKKIVEGYCIRKTIDAQGTASEIINAWCEAIETAMQFRPGKVRKIGFAMPGPFDYGNGISYITQQNKYESLYRINVKQLISDRLQVDAKHIRFMNDAACFLQGEVFSGAACGCKTVFGLTLGTGLGTARFSNGVAEDANLWCSPFRESIAEDYLSTRWFIKRCHELTGVQLNGVKDILQHTPVAYCLQQLFGEFADNLAVFITSIVSSGLPEKIVIGGNIALAHHYFFPRLEQNLCHAGIYIKPVKALLGEIASVYGAAGSWSFINVD